MTAREDKPTSVSPLLTVAVCLTLFIGTLLLFSRAINHDFIDLDDPDYVTGNPHVQGGFTGSGVYWAFTSGDAANWHPVTWLSHMLDWRFFGRDPRGHHAVNVFWHALNAMLAFLVLRRLTGAFWTSAVSAALFAWHPLRVESVAWVSERKDVLSVFFGLLSLWAYARYAQRVPNGKSASVPRHRSIFYALTLATFAVGLMCKPMLVTLPFLLLLLDWWPLRRFNGSTVQRLLMEKIPFFLLSTGSCVITFLVQKKAGAVVDTITLTDRLANAVVSVTRYLGDYFRPFDLAIGYPSPAHWPLVSVVFATLLISALTGLAIQQHRRRPWLLVGWLWFIGMLVPVIGLVQVGLQAMADRYTYLPVLGLQLALLWTLREMLLPTTARRLAPALAALMLGLCAARTWNQLAFWRDARTLHEHALAVTRGNYLAESYLGTTLLNEERFAEAAVHFRRAIELKTNYVEAHYRLGFALDKLERRDEAMAEYETVLKINPRFGIAHYNLGALLLGQHQPSNAIVHFEAALKIKPDYDPALLGLGSARSELGRPREAIPYFEKALAINPGNPVAEFNYANALSDLEQYEEARARYEKALDLDPEFAEARCNYGNALRALGRAGEAEEQYRRAIALQPRNADAYFGLGAALEDLDRADEALACYLKAGQHKPGFADAEYNAGTLLLGRSRAAEAVPHFQAAVKSQPNYVAARLGWGLAAAQLGNHPEAIAQYKQALAIEPDNAMALCNIGVALRRQGRPAEAIPYYERALQVNPDYAEAHAEIGNALYRTGRAAEAVPHLEQALRLHPGFPGVAEILDRARGGTDFGADGGDMARAAAAADPP